MRVAIVGTGARGVDRLRVAADLRDEGLLEDLVVCGADEARARELADCFDASCRTDVTALSADAAVVATPPSIRHDVGTRLLAEGIDLLVEAPLSPSAADAWNLVDAADAHDRTLAVANPLRHHPALVALGRRVERGDLGTVRYVQTNRFAAGCGRPASDVLRSVAVRTLDAYSFLLGSTTPDASETGVVRSDDGDELTLVLDYDGTTGVVTASRRVPASGACHHVIAVGSDRIAYADLVENGALELYDADAVDGNVDDLEPDLVATGAETAVPSRVETIDFLHAVETGGTPRAPGRAGAEAVDLLEAAVDDRGRAAPATDVAESAE